MRVICPGCKKQYYLSIDKKGRWFRCKVCSGEILAEEVDELEEVGEYQVKGEPRAAPMPVVVAAIPVPEPFVERATLGPLNLQVKALQKRFGSLDLALKHFAQAMRAAYPLSAARGACISCGAEGRTPHECTWRRDIRVNSRINWLSLATIFGGYVVFNRKVEFIEFQTYHPMCGRCGGITRIARVGSKVLEWVSLLALFGAILLYKRQKNPQEPVFWYIVLAATPFTLLLILQPARWWAVRRLKNIRKQVVLMRVRSV